MLEEQEKNTEEEDAILKLLQQRKPQVADGLVFARRNMAPTDSLSGSNRKFWKSWENLAAPARETLT